MKTVALSNDGELKKLLERLVGDIIDAGGYARLCMALSASHPEYKNEIRQTPGFWNFTAAALREACLMRLARIYDQQPHSLSLLSLLHVIGNHTHFFGDDAVLRRVSAAYAEEFKAGSHKIDPALLAADIKLVFRDDPLVKKLIVWRSNFGAHLSTDPILKSGIRGRTPLCEADVFALIDRAFEIYNRYLFAFEGTSCSKRIIGEDDYQFLFHLLRLGLAKFKADGDAFP